MMKSQPIAEVTGTRTYPDGRKEDTVRVMRACGHLEITAANHGAFLPHVAVKLLCLRCEEASRARDMRVQKLDAEPDDLIAAAIQALRPLRPDPGVDRAIRLLERALIIGTQPA